MCACPADIASSAWAPLRRFGSRKNPPSLWFESSPKATQLPCKQNAIGQGPKLLIRQRACSAFTTAATRRLFRHAGTFAEKSRNRGTSPEAQIWTSTNSDSKPEEASNPTPPPPSTQKARFFPVFEHPCPRKCLISAFLANQPQPSLIAIPVLIVAVLRHADAATCKDKETLAEHPKKTSSQTFKAEAV